MTVRTKPVLKQMIADMLLDNTDREISEADVRTVLDDFVDSLLDRAAVVAGAGITVDERDDGVTIGAGGAAAGAGLPAYLATAVAHPSSDLITADITGLPGDPPSPSLVYIFMPSDLGRTVDDLSLTVNGGSQRALRTVLGATVQARLITPGSLHALLTRTSVATNYYLTELLEPRPQDWDLVVAWLEGDESAGFTIEDVNLGAVFQTPEITIPDQPPGVIRNNVGGLLAIGTPLDARPIRHFLTRGGQVSQALTGRAGVLQVSALSGVLDVGGVPYRWYTTQNVNDSIVGNEYTAVYGNYP